ncbi:MULTISPECIES: DUF6250 domain-containing protein [unclassified Arcicella]|nr:MULTISPECIES: DUF6250 domain-containing protein [unclassified Arcicella]MDR6562457.1 rhamnogalacturonan endolyase [Arcicella sp. BE51]MDR6812190.1 rhamnogalacturonan endolyase [Arcicella sp. BE140]MDR6823521.1 rhamnogalacturonan endolyase [Arcicella sp. BE139]
MLFLISSIYLLQTGCKSSNIPHQNELYSENFKGKLNTKKWVSEIEPLANSKVYTDNGKLVLDTKGGVSVWFNQPLQGNYIITFKRKIIVNGGVNDRLSDLNVFWLTEAPANANLFTRSGKFEEYDNLKMYYVGMGGNTNTTTRFRKYQGNGDRKLLAEKNDAHYLLKANHEYQIKIIVKDDITSFWVDDEKFFEGTDEHFPSKSYFGFRSTFSHQEIWDFKVFKD